MPRNTSVGRSPIQTEERDDEADEQYGIMSRSVPTY